jgi:hypothetical protein
MVCQQATQSNTAGAFIRSPWIMTGARDTRARRRAPTHRLVSSNILQNSPRNVPLRDQALAPRAGLPPTSQTGSRVVQTPLNMFCMENN